MRYLKLTGNKLYWLETDMKLRLSPLSIHLHKIGVKNKGVLHVLDYAMEYVCRIFGVGYCK